MEETVKQIVKSWIYNKHRLVIDFDNIFIVWSCYILGNSKYLVGTTKYNYYFEITYNKSQNEWYLDVYNKIDNQKYDRI